MNDKKASNNRRKNKFGGMNCSADIAEFNKK